MTQFEGIELLLQEGDVITSKMGILFKDTLVRGRGQIVHRVQYEGKGGWRVLESSRYPREFVDMRKVGEEDGNIVSE